MSQPQQYGQYGAPYGTEHGTPPGAPQRTDVTAVLGLVFAFLVPIVGLVLSIIGLNRTKRDGTAGRGLALAGLIISIVFIALTLILLIGLFTFAATSGTTSP